MSYSGNSGTLTLPSPTHCSSNADFSSAARSVERIRRSLSRSPSKFQLKKSPGGGCGSPRSPLSPSPLTAGGSPSKQLGSPFLGTSTHTKSPLATPFAPSAKLSLRSAKHKIPSTHPKRTSPRSPLKRVLSESLDRANTQPQAMRTSTSFGGENLSADMANPPRRKSFEKQPQKSFFSIEIPPPANQALARMELDADIYTPGPLKRTDSTMNLDTASLGSPMPKRRSMHGSANFGQDFNAFDHAPPMTSTPKFDIHEDLTENVAQAPSPIFSSTPMKFQNVNMPKRSTSLRKSTLQQRQEKSTSWNRKQAERMKAAAAAQGHSIGSGFSTPQKPKDRPRLSLDQFIEPSVERNSPFTAGHLPNPSMHMFNQPHKAHPLSRTLTQSSSSGSITDESPTHAPFHAPARIPVKFDDNTRPRLDFSKSLPAGALRPTAVDHLKLESSNEFQTPKNDYQNAKPHAAAFMSTGLVSKMKANMDEPQSAARHHLRKSIMPDTPCKKPMSGYHTIPAPGTNAMNKVKEFTRHSFGTPSIPFGSAMKPSIVSRNVFGSDFSNKGRRGSFLSIAPESHTSPENLDNLMSDNDMPPTPTKSIFNEQPGDGSPKSMRGNPFSMYSLNKPTRQSSKLSIQIATCESSESSDVEEFGDIVSPTAVSFRLSRSSLQSGMSSFGRSRARKGSNAPAPLSLGSPKHFLSPPHQGSAKIPTLTADSPQERIDFEVRHSPHTPHVGVGDLSEDASRLTVSGHGRRPLTRQNTMADFNVAKAPPATPTTGRDTVLPNGELTPVHVPKVSDIDEHLTSRFDKVETIGGGEFSDVYRVTQMSSYFANQSCHYGGSYGGPAGSFGTPSQVVSQTPPTPRVAVFAVKKSRKPYTGPSDRAKRMREVNILHDLGKSEHVIHLEDHWEIDGYLYIQTEFCEEGSLDNFLANAGRKGRLDDFRIWKIMVELGEGIKHIHKAGYIHLDLKPANIFITFEGVLKIGDFGMASSYPAPADIDGEGDREYIGPEILEGRFDKPADIFAFGLIMLEIAANVQLPDNGPSWQRLRSGDMSDVPSLTWSQGSVVRDSRGEVICDEGLMGGSDTSLELVSDDEMDCEEQLPAGSGRKRNFNPTKTRSTSHDPANLFGSVRRGERKVAPSFMVDQNHGSSIDKIVNEMICPNPAGRPTIEAIMRTEGVVWVKARRRAGATVFEGTYGPDDTVLTGSFEESGSGSGGEDAEMIDV